MLNLVVTKTITFKSIKYEVKEVGKRRKKSLKEEILLLKVNKAKYSFLSSVEVNKFFQKLLINVWDGVMLNDKQVLTQSNFTTCSINLHLL